MQSITAKKLRLAYDPVAILWCNTKPEACLADKTPRTDLHHAFFRTGGNPGENGSL